MRYKTEQETFWASSFGDEYSLRNVGAAGVAANLALFSRILAHTRGVRSVIEFGANVGLNLRALRPLLPDAELSAIEINETALAGLRKLEGIHEIIAGSILEFEPQKRYDLTLIKGVLIHIPPDRLPEVYAKLVAASGRYLCVVEYYNPAPVEVRYRGHEERLWKRDFAGDLLDHYPALRLVDYGFVYRRDPNFAADDITWFLLENGG